MKKTSQYNQDSKEYQDLINSFLNRFESYFKTNNPQELIDLFHQNLKSIKKHQNQVSFKHPLLGYLNGLYKSNSKQLEYADSEDNEATIYHEMFHALSDKARRKRDSLLKFFLIIYFGQKQLSVREFEEGMTEYLTTCIMGETEKHIRFTFPQETTIINKLAKIYGDNLILDYYLGKNTHLVEAMNQDIPDSFNQVVKLCQKVSTNESLPVPFEQPKYTKKDQTISNELLLNLFTKRKLKEVQTIDDFKHNLKELFSFYESDLYKVCYDISLYEESLSEAKEKEDLNLINLNQHQITSSAILLQNFNNIIRKEWNKLGINDEELYNNLILDEIEKFNKFASSVIIDYLDYWNNDISQIYQQRNSPSTNNNISQENSSSKKESLKELKTDLLNAISANQIDYPNIPKSQHR